MADLLMLKGGHSSKLQKRNPEPQPPPQYEAGVPPAYSPYYASPAPAHSQAQPQLVFGQGVQTPPPAPIIVVPAPVLGPNQVRTICQHCQSQIKTRTDSKPSLVAWLSAGVMCVLGLWCGCCLIPFLVDSCMDTDHECPNCGAHLGRHRAF